MLKISEIIKKETDKLNIPLVLNTDFYNSGTFKILKKKYICQDSKNQLLWENLLCYEILNDKNGWNYIKNFVGTNLCVMFFNYNEDKSSITINDGIDLDSILSETYRFEFYITNYEADYIICFNHHDCLIGCGTAKKWIKSLCDTIIQ